jgi:hypothetical protein
VTEKQRYSTPRLERRGRLVRVTEGVNGRVTDGLVPPPPAP